MRLTVMCFDERLCGRGNAQPGCCINSNTHCAGSNHLANFNARGKTCDREHFNINTNSGISASCVEPEQLEGLVGDPAGGPEPARDL